MGTNGSQKPYRQKRKMESLPENCGYFKGSRWNLQKVIVCCGHNERVERSCPHLYLLSERQTIQFSKGSPPTPRTVRGGSVIGRWCPWYDDWLWRGNKVHRRQTNSHHSHRESHTAACLLFLQTNCGLKGKSNLKLQFIKQWTKQ